MSPLSLVLVLPVVVALNERVVGNVSQSAILSFRVNNAAPPVMTSDLHWYYTTNTISGDPDFTSSDYQDITNSTGRTSTSTLTFSEDLLTLNVSNIHQALVAGEETDAGKYFLRASNAAGEDSSFIELVVFGE